MRISLRFDLTPNLLDVVTSSLHFASLLIIGGVRIKATAVSPCMIARFRIAVVNSSSSFVPFVVHSPAGDLSDLHPLLLQGHYLLVAVIALRLVGRERDVHQQSKKGR